METTYFSPENLFVLQAGISAAVCVFPALVKNENIPRALNLINESIPHLQNVCLQNMGTIKALMYVSLVISQYAIPVLTRFLNTTEPELDMAY